MAWQDRLRPAAYRAPSGVRQEFMFEDVSRTTEKNTTAFNFPDKDGTLVQDLGHKGWRYPLRLFFSGADHDEESDNFARLLTEPGVGVLEHPRWGQIDVVPFGEIIERDNLKTEANQTVIEVKFFSTISTAYPTSQQDGPAESIEAVDEYQETASAELAESVDFTDPTAALTFKDQWESFLDSTEEALREVANAQDDIGRKFQNISDSINRGIDVLIADPLTLAFQTTILIRTPARVVSQISARLDAYTDLASSIITSGSGRLGSSDGESLSITAPTTSARAANEFASRQQFAQSAVAGAVEATMFSAQDPTGYSTRSEAISAAETLLELFAWVQMWADLNYRNLNGTDSNGTPVLDTGGGYQQLQKAVALAAGVLIQLSFSLKQERRIVLDRPRSMVDFVAEQYGGVDEFLDFFINTNNLTGTEILEGLPKGKTVVVYV